MLFPEFFVFSQVLEINPSVERTGKYVFDKVAEAVVSHQVQKGFKKLKQNQQDLLDAAKGTKQLTRFFAGSEKKVKNIEKNETLTKEKITKTDAMSLVLFEQVSFTRSAIVFTTFSWKCFQNTNCESSVFSHLNIRKYEAVVSCWRRSFSGKYQMHDKAAVRLFSILNKVTGQRLNHNRALRTLSNIYDGAFCKNS